MPTDFNFIMSQIIGIVTTVLAIISMPLKSMKPILILQLIVNLTTALSYLFADGFSGAWICIVAILQTLCCYVYNQKEKKFPLPLTVFFILAYIACSALNFKTLFDILPAAAAIAYALSILTTHPSVFRIYTLANCALWLAYDISTAAYTTALLHVILFICSLVSIIRLDQEDWKQFFAKHKKA